MNINKLKGKMAETNYTQCKLAKELGLSLQSLNAKLNNRSKLTLDEAVKITKILSIDDPKEIFF